MPRKNLKNNEKSIKLNELFTDFSHHCRAKNLSWKTIKNYQNSYDCFQLFYQSQGIGDLNMNTIEDFVIFMQEETGNNDRSIKTRISGLRTFLYYLIQHEYIEDFKIQLPRVQETVKETYSDDELKRLLKKPKMKNVDFAEYRTWVIINFLLATGCRCMTIREMKIKDVDFESGFISYRHTKNRKAQMIPLSNTLAKVLREYLRYRKGNEDDYLFISIYEQKLTYSAFANSVKKYNNKRKVYKTSIHAFRHTFSKNWILSGGDIFRLQKILGHSSMEMVRNYVNLFNYDLVDNFNQFNALEKFSQKRVSMR